MSNAKLVLDRPIRMERRFGGGLKPIYDLGCLHTAMLKGLVLTLEGHTGVIVSIRAEDGSGKSWLVRMANPVVIGFWLWSARSTSPTNGSIGSRRSDGQGGGHLARPLLVRLQQDH